MVGQCGGDTHAASGRRPGAPETPVAARYVRVRVVCAFVHVVGDVALP